MIQTGVYRLPDRHSKYLARKTAIPFRAFFMCANAQNALEQKGMIETGVDGCLYLPFYKHPKYLARRRPNPCRAFFRLLLTPSDTMSRAAQTISATC